jgi:hypothetical protein
MLNSDKPAMPTNARMGSDATGLTKREHIAALALQGILSNRELQLALYADMKFYKGCTNENCLSFHALREADELLKQLEL